MADTLDSILSRYKPARREDLIPMLQEIQKINGMISEEAIVKVGNLLGMSTSRIFGLATFYDQFRFFPTGKIHLRICNGTTCYLNGSQSIIKQFKDELGIDPGQTTRDGTFSYEVVSCAGGCNNGPLIYMNGEYLVHVKSEQIPALLKRLRFTVENN
jgi:NADH:ubiquinone oxidoreductase subunit E